MHIQKNVKDCFHIKNQKNHVLERKKILFIIAQSKQPHLQALCSGDGIRPGAPDAGMRRGPGIHPDTGMRRGPGIRPEASMFQSYDFHVYLISRQVDLEDENGNINSCSYRLLPVRFTCCLNFLETKVKGKNDVLRLHHSFLQWYPFLIYACICCYSCMRSPAQRQRALKLMEGAWLLL